MVVTAVIKSLCTCVLEYNTLVLVSAERICWCHVTDISIAEGITVYTCTARNIPVVAEWVIPCVADLDHAWVLKEVRCTGIDRCTWDRDHVRAELSDTSLLCLSSLSVWNTAAVCDDTCVCIRIIVNAWIEEPCYVTVRCISWNDFVSERILYILCECRVISCDNADTWTIVCEVKEELVLTVDLLPCSIRSPSVVSPFCNRCAVYSCLCNRDLTVVCPVYEVCWW